MSRRVGRESSNKSNLLIEHPYATETQKLPCTRITWTYGADHISLQAFQEVERVLDNGLLKHGEGKPATGRVLSVGIRLKTNTLMDRLHICEL